MKQDAVAVVAELQQLLCHAGGLFSAFQSGTVQDDCMEAPAPKAVQAQLGQLQG